MKVGEGVSFVALNRFLAHIILQNLLLFSTKALGENIIFLNFTL